MRPLDNLIDTKARIAALCPIADSSDGVVRSRERSLGARLDTPDHGVAWRRAADQLLCVRVVAYERQKVAFEGYLMPGGLNHGSGIVNLFDAILDANPESIFAIRSLATAAPALVWIDTTALLPNEERPFGKERPGPIGNRLFAAVRGGVRDSVVFRAARAC